eukprot:TRINITY_DN15185_c0_g1_i2.p1 TRINITY_DN15185_c0_g1~~TRINITY_DN15185_c0_g1_i2.p1  ORF type:complete len:312 (+),score=66.86 TRINITY_DN15185_c0_g1_i2:130-936(+)
MPAVQPRPAVVAGVVAGQKCVPSGASMLSGQLRAATATEVRPPAASAVHVPPPPPRPPIAPGKDLGENAGKLLSALAARVQAEQPRTAAAGGTGATMPAAATSAEKASAARSGVALGSATRPIGAPLASAGKGPVAPARGSSHTMPPSEAQKKRPLEQPTKLPEKRQRLANGEAAAAAAASSGKIAGFQPIVRQQQGGGSCAAASQAAHASNPQTLASRPPSLPMAPPRAAADATAVPGTRPPVPPVPRGACGSQTPVPARPPVPRGA